MIILIDFNINREISGSRSIHTYVAKLTGKREVKEL